MRIKAIDHIELSVNNLDRSQAFYEKVPGFKLVAKYPNFLMFSCGNFKLGLTDHKGELTSKTSSEFNVGLDHVSFLLNSNEDLTEALNWLEREKIKHGEIKELSNKGKVLAFRDPDNIQLEFIYRGS